MAKSPLFGRRIHIAGSISEDLSIASAEEVGHARELVEILVKDLLQKGATFVIPVDAEKLRPLDKLPICFDWLIWETIYKNISSRSADAPRPLVIAVKHHKNEEQIPEQFAGLWDSLRSSDLVQIDSAAHWNLNSKRMEVQARSGDILIALGGGEGVQLLANLYHDAGKPVIPLNFKLGAPDKGAARLFEYGKVGNHAQRLFQTNADITPHNWINQIDFPARIKAADRVQKLLELLEALVSPTAFVVRLLNQNHADYDDVQNFFDTVVKPIIEDELGYKLTVVDGEQKYDHACIDQEIFTKLHRSRIVLADITGLRPNCFLELGYALGRSLPTMLLAKEGTELPFDIHSLSGLHWKTSGTAEERRIEFRKHWNAIKNRPPLVPTEPLIP